MSEPSVTVLLPAFNEELSIGETIREIKSRYPDFEVLVVDDASTDQTMQKAMAAGANVWPHPYNMGNGAAIKTGLRCASGEWVVMMDADGQHDPADIAGFLPFRDRYDMVVGARVRGSQASFFRGLANRLYNGLASYVAKFKVEDLTSGFRMVRRQTAMKYVYLLPNTFSYPSTLTLGYLRSGRAVKYVPIRTRPRQGKSKINIARDGARFLLIITRIATLYSPFRIFLPISFFFAFSGLSYYFYTFLTQHRFTNMSAMLLTSAVIIFMIGLVSEQISQMRYDRVE